MSMLWVAASEGCQTRRGTTTINSTDDMSRYVSSCVHSLCKSQIV
jgi:hypothetical protein